MGGQEHRTTTTLLQLPKFYIPQNPGKTALQPNQPKSQILFYKKAHEFGCACIGCLVNCMLGKGHLILKADWRAIDSPKKRTDEFVLFAFLLFTANKSNLSVRFLGESTVRQSAF